MDLFEGPDLGHTTNFIRSEKGKGRKEKSTAPSGNRTHDLMSLAPEGIMLFRCAAATAPLKVLGSNYRYVTRRGFSSFTEISTYEWEQPRDAND